jgi:hypothetical protein
MRLRETIAGYDEMLPAGTGLSAEPGRLAVERNPQPTIYQVIITDGLATVGLATMRPETLGSLLPVIRSEAESKDDNRFEASVGLPPARQLPFHQRARTSSAVMMLLPLPTPPVAGSSVFSNDSSASL